MLNVAVSRAKDSFLVFGDTRIFDRRKSTPSGILARHIFASSNNEITDLPAYVRHSIGKHFSVELLGTLEEHRSALVNAFKTAKEKVIVVSPWILIDVVKIDNLEEHIRDCTDRNVKVIIYADRDFNKDHAAKFESATKLLSNAGAELRVVTGAHNKELTVDSSMLIVGSFNWLSAVRDENHKYHRKNRSSKITGNDVAEMIIEVEAEMEDMFKRSGKHPI